jgi:hypothetical protein
VYNSSNEVKIILNITYIEYIIQKRQELPMEEINHQRAEWFYQSRWGIFIHYLGILQLPANIYDPNQNKLTADAWNDRIDRFDVEGLARQLHELNAHYLIFTIGQISGHYCAPNLTYDSLVGISPSKCSKRDLIGDIAKALQKYNIPLMVYFPSDAPRYDKIATRALGWKPWQGSWEKWAFLSSEPKLASFQRKWEAIIRDFSLRWGSSIKGWWFDGCYSPKAMYFKKRTPNFGSFAAAARVGNPDSIIAFNPGVKVPIISLTPEEDYTAGEISDTMPECSGRYIQQAQFHMLTYLGKTWGMGEPRFSPEFVSDFTQKIVNQGGVLTWDVGVSIEGLIVPDLFDTIRILKSLPNRTE